MGNPNDPFPRLHSDYGDSIVNNIIAMKRRNQRPTRVVDSSELVSSIRRGERLGDLNDEISRVTRRDNDKNNEYD